MYSSNFISSVFSHYKKEIIETFITEHKHQSMDFGNVVMSVKPDTDKTFIITLSIEDKDYEFLLQYNKKECEDFGKKLKLLCVIQNNSTADTIETIYNLEF